MLFLRCFDIDWVVSSVFYLWLCPAALFCRVFSKERYLLSWCNIWNEHKVERVKADVQQGWSKLFQRCWCFFFQTIGSRHFKLFQISMEISFGSTNHPTDSVKKHVEDRRSQPSNRLICHWNRPKTPGWWAFVLCIAHWLVRWRCLCVHSKMYDVLGGGFKYFYFHPHLGKISNLTNMIFQLGWNHQPVYVFLCKHTLHVCIFIHLATRNADVFLRSVVFCLHVSRLPLFSTASQKPLHLSCCQVGSSKNSTE